MSEGKEVELGKCYVYTDKVGGVSEEEVELRKGGAKMRWSK